MPTPGSVWATGTWQADAWAADTWADAEEAVEATEGSRSRNGRRRAGFLFRLVFLVAMGVACG